MLDRYALTHTSIMMKLGLTNKYPLDRTTPESSNKIPLKNTSLGFGLDEGVSGAPCLLTLHVADQPTYPSR